MMKILFSFTSNTFIVLITNTIFYSFTQLASDIEDLFHNHLDKDTVTDLYKDIQIGSTLQHKIKNGSTTGMCMLVYVTSVNIVPTESYSYYLQHMH